MMKFNKNDEIDEIDEIDGDYHPNDAYQGFNEFHFQRICYEIFS